jgi:SP family xylose:H+ symportor-like MFS transporter
MHLSGVLVRSTLTAALGGLLFGFDTAVISGTTDALKRVYQLNEPWLGLPGSFWLGFTVASALIGTVIGAAIAARPADTWGRRTTLVVTAVRYFVSAMGSGLAWSWNSFNWFRFIGGIAVGVASVVSPMYIAEIAPASHRGRLVAVQQFNIVLGILLAFFSNYVIQQAGIGEHAWRWMFGVEAIPAAAFFFLLFAVPRSPRWLLSQQRDDEARRVLADVGCSDVDGEVAAIRQSLDLAHHEFDERFFQGKYRTPILLAVAIAAFNQFSGINALMYYGPQIFRMAGAAEGSDLLQTVAVGGTNLLFTMLAMAVIDHFGRRKLMLVGSLGYLASLSACAWAFYAYDAEFRAATSAGQEVAKIQAELAASEATAADSLSRELALAQETATQAYKNSSRGGMVVLVSLIGFIAAHAFGQGAVIWVFIGEIFPNRVRARGQSLGSFTHWIMAAVISWTFPIIAEQSGGHAFAFYAAMMGLQLAWVLCVMPETKGVPLEEIQKRLGIE